MTLILDTGPVVTRSNVGNPDAAAVEEALASEDGPLIIPAPVSAEIDYLIGKRYGSSARRLFISDLAANRYQVECLQTNDYQTVLELDLRYADLDLGLADISIIVLADRFNTDRILTFDTRDFRAITPIQGGTFTLLPADL